MLLHLWALHVHGSNNPLGIDAKGPQDKIPFHPYYTVKDAFGMSVFLIVYAYFVFFNPYMLGDPDNWIPANPMVTPPHIVPEWYFLPFYAILRAVPDKLGGVLLMFGAIIILFLLPWLDTSRVRSGRFRPAFRVFFWLFIVVTITLGWCGAQLPEGIPLILGQVCTVLYFAHFLVFLPLLGWFERPRPLPASISEPVLAK